MTHDELIEIRDDRDRLMATLNRLFKEFNAAHPDVVLRAEIDCRRGCTVLKALEVYL